MNKILLGIKIRQLREQKNMTQMQLAEKIDITDRGLSKIEVGRVSPQLETLISIASVLGVSIDYLVSENTAFDKQLYIHEITERISLMEEQEIKHILGYIDFYVESEKEKLLQIN